MSWRKGRVFISEVFRSEKIGLEQMDEDVHRVFFCKTELGEFNSSERGSVPRYGLEDGPTSEPFREEQRIVNIAL